MDTLKIKKNRNSNCNRRHGESAQARYGPQSLSSWTLEGDERTARCCPFDCRGGDSSRAARPRTLEYTYRTITVWHGDVLVVAGTAAVSRNAGVSNSTPGRIRSTPLHPHALSSGKGHRYSAVANADHSGIE